MSSIDVLKHGMLLADYEGNCQNGALLKKIMTLLEGTQEYTDS
jgi:hypothetical protein